MTKESVDQRQAPSAGFIEDIRAAYPVEREIDRVLTRKMNNRPGQGYTGVTLETMQSCTTALIKSKFEGKFSIANVRWLIGGASKIQMAFDFTSHEETAPFKAGEVRAMVVRMEPAESVVETSRMREFEVVKFLQGRVPVPACHWVDDDAAFFPYPALIYEFIEGVVKPTHVSSKQVSGIGINFGSDLRPIIAEQFVQHLAAIHTIPLEKLQALKTFDLPEPGSNASVIKQVNWWKRVWEEDHGEDIPLMEIAYQWLIDNAPPLETPSLVHGDYRSGNFLYSEATNRITGILDWELALVGDRHQDLAWSSYKVFGHMAEDDKTFLVSGLMAEEAFFRQYEKASGLSVDPERLLYYRILCNFMSVVHSLGSAYRVSSSRKTHQDIVLGTFTKIGNILLDQLRVYLEEVNDAA